MATKTTDPTLLARLEAYRAKCAPDKTIDEVIAEIVEKRLDAMECGQARELAEAIA